jgi:hypothetical protein
VAVGHSFVEYDLRGDRGEADRVLGTLRNRVVILLAMGPLAAQAAHEVLPNVPMVFCMIQDPGKIGIAPGPNTTGVAFTIPVKNQLAAFRMVNPRGVRVGVVYTDANVGKLVDEAQKAASLVRLSLVGKPVPRREVPVRCARSRQRAADAIWIPRPRAAGRGRSATSWEAPRRQAGLRVHAVAGREGRPGQQRARPGVHRRAGGDLVNRLAAGERGRIEMLVPRAER